MIKQYDKFFLKEMMNDRTMHHVNIKFDCSELFMQFSSSWSLIAALHPNYQHSYCFHLVELEYNKERGRG